MQALALLVGFWCASVTLAVGYITLPLAFLALTVAVVLVLREHDRRRD